MSKKLIKFPSIEQFRHVITDITRRYTFAGLDQNGEPLYDETKKLPAIEFIGTVKLHGTNAGICFNNVDGHWFQSRESIISVGNDNYGFSSFCEQNIDSFNTLFSKISERHKIDLTKNTISIFGEWCGKGIQKNVGVANLPKSFFVFGVLVSPMDDPENKIRDNEKHIYNINDFGVYHIFIDFNNPQSQSGELAELTIKVEEECPVAKALGVEGIGEGIVWSAVYDKKVYRFKTKGEKHSSSKGKTIAPVDTERVNNIAEFVEYAVTESRFNQAIDNVFPNKAPVDIKKLGDVIKWVLSDIVKEESDTMEKNGLVQKDIAKAVSDAARKMFFKIY
jgi:hypothetical protein